MRVSCTISPRVRSEKTGELVDSKLFADLKKAVGYQTAREIYIQVRKPEFVEEFDDALLKDENGEYTFSSLSKLPELSSKLGTRKRRSYAAENLGAYKPEPYNEASSKAAEQLASSYNAQPNNARCLRWQRM